MLSGEVRGTLRRGRGGHDVAVNQVTCGPGSSAEPVFSGGDGDQQCNMLVIIKRLGLKTDVGFCAVGDTGGLN